MFHQNPEAARCVAPFGDVLQRSSSFQKEGGPALFLRRLFSSGERIGPLAWSTCRSLLAAKGFRAGAVAVTRCAPPKSSRLRSHDMPMSRDLKSMDDSACHRTSLCDSDRFYSLDANLGEFADEVCRPAINIVVFNYRPHAPHASAPLLRIHLKGIENGVGQLLGIVGIHDESIAHFPRRSCEPAQDKSSLLVVPGCNKLFSHQVHAVV